MADLGIETREAGGVSVLALTGEFDLAGVQKFEGMLKSLESQAPDVLAVDLNGLQFMDSSGLRVLVTAHARAADGGPQFAIVRAPEGSEVAKILDIAGVEQQLNVLDEP